MGIGMTDFIVDPTGRITDVRSRTVEKQADADIGSKKVEGAPRKVRNTRLFRGFPMSRIAIAGLVVAFIIELGVGAWLYREREAVTTAQKSIEQRESVVSSRETNADHREASNQTKSETLASQEGSLEAMEARLNSEDTRLDSVEKDLKAKETELEEKDRVLAKREKDDEDEEDDQAFALAFVQDAFGSIRMQIERQQVSGGSWPPDTHASSPSPDMPPDATTSGSVLSLAKQLEQLEARYVQIDESKPEAESSVAGRMAALAELASECAELIAKGSIDSLQIQAGIEVDLEILRDLAVRLRLSEEAIPKNQYELLESNRLADLELLQTKKVAFLKERDTLFSGLYQGALADAESTLKQMTEAKAKRPSDPTPLFAKAIIERKLSPADAAALRAATNGEERVAAINLRYAQLLHQQLAIRWWDINVRQRMHDTVALLSPETREQFRNINIKLTYIDLLSASTPYDPKALRVNLESLLKSPETVGEAVTQYVSKRYSDPIRAAELYAMLEAAYAADNGEVVAAEDRTAFKEWLVGHLTPGKVYELLTLRIEPLLGIFSDLEAINDPRGPHADDRNEVEETRRALLTENARRRVDLLAQEARLNSTLSVDRPDPQRLYSILRVLVERAGTPELRSAWLETAFDGLAAQLDVIDSAKNKAELAIAENEQSVSRLRALGQNVDQPGEIPLTHLTLAGSYKSVELRLSSLLAENPNNARAELLLTRTRAGLGAIPPPASPLSNVKAALDWADPIVAEQIQKVLAQQLRRVEASTETNIAARNQLQAQRDLKARQMIERARIAQTRVDVYGRMSCSRTKQVLEIYKEQGITARFHDIDSDFTAKAELRNVILKDDLLPLVKVNGKSLNAMGEELTFERILKSCKR